MKKQFNVELLELLRNRFDGMVSDKQLVDISNEIIFMVLDCDVFGQKSELV